MIHEEPFPIKKVGIWFLMICCGMITAYIIFIGFVSIRLGLRHLPQDGFWVPILSGTFTILLTLWVFFRLSIFFLKKQKDEDLINL